MLPRSSKSLALFQLLNFQIPQTLLSPRKSTIGKERGLPARFYPNVTVYSNLQGGGSFVYCTKQFPEDFDGGEKFCHNHVSSVGLSQSTVFASSLSKVKLYGIEVKLYEIGDTFWTRAHVRLFKSGFCSSHSHFAIETQQLQFNRFHTKKRKQFGERQRERLISRCFGRLYNYQHCRRQYSQSAAISLANRIIEDGGVNVVLSHCTETVESNKLRDRKEQRGQTILSSLASNSHDGNVGVSSTESGSETPIYVTGVKETDEWEEDGGPTTIIEGTDNLKSEGKAGVVPGGTDLWASQATSLVSSNVETMPQEESTTNGAVRLSKEYRKENASIDRVTNLHMGDEVEEQNVSATRGKYCLRRGTASTEQVDYRVEEVRKSATLSSFGNSQVFKDVLKALVIATNLSLAGESCELSVQVSKQQELPAVSSTTKAVVEATSTSLKNVEFSLADRLDRHLSEQLHPWHGQLQSSFVSFVIKGGNDLDLVTAVFRWAKSQPGFIPKTELFTKVIQVARSAKNSAMVEEVWEEMKNSGCKPTIWTLAEVGRTYLESDRLDEAFAIVLQALEDSILPDPALIGALMESFARNKRTSEGFKLYQLFQEKGGKPEHRLFNTLVTLYGLAKDFRGAKHVMQEMVHAGYTADRFTYSRLITQYCRNYKMVEAKKILKKMIAEGVKPDARTYNCLIDAYARKGLENEALLTMKQMEDQGIKPISSSFNMLLDMYAHERRWEKAEEVFRVMEERGLQPDPLTYGIMMHAYLQGSTEKAKEMLTRLKKEGGQIDLRLYTMLLQGCFECEVQEEVELLLDMLEDLKHPLHGLIQVIFQMGPEGEEDSMWKEVKQYLILTQGEPKDVRQGFVNGVMQWLCKAGCEARAAKFLETARHVGIFPNVSQKGATLNIDLHDMGPAMAVLATRLLLMDLHDMATDETELPSEVGIITGWGKGSSLKSGSVVQQSVLAYLEELESPFLVAKNNKGRIFARGRWLRGWLLQRGKWEKIELRDRV